ncbi:hypothetical protein Tco_1499985 [Tanacetum coccineum]
MTTNSWVLHRLFCLDPYSHLDITSEYNPGSAGRTSITPDSIHAGVPTGKDNFIVSAGRPNMVLAGRTIRESKARTTLLQSIPDDHMADFHYMDDARDIWKAVKARISEAEGLHKGYDRMQKILSQLNQLKAKPEDKDINLKFLRALPSSWSQLKTLEVDIKEYSTFSSSQSASPSHYAFVSTTSASKKMSYADSPSYAPSNSKTGSHRSGNIIEDVLQSFVADTEPEQQLAYEDFEQIEKLDLEEMDLKWFNKKKEIGKKEEDSKALITVDKWFAKADSMKAVPPPLSRDYTPLSDHIDLDESQMSYGTKSSTSGDSNSSPSQLILTLCINSSVSTSESKAEIESNVGTPIQEPIIVQDLPSFSCNSSDKE